MNEDDDLDFTVDDELMRETISNIGKRGGVTLTHKNIVVNVDFRGDLNLITIIVSMAALVWHFL